MGKKKFKQNIYIIRTGVAASSTVATSAKATVSKCSLLVHSRSSPSGFSFLLLQAVRVLDVNLGILQVTEGDRRLGDDDIGATHQVPHPPSHRRVVQRSGALVAVLPTLLLLP